MWDVFEGSRRKRVWVDVCESVGVSERERESAKVRETERKK